MPALWFDSGDILFEIEPRNSKHLGFSRQANRIRSYALSQLISPRSRGSFHLTFIPSADRSQHYGLYFHFLIEETESSGQMLMRNGIHLYSDPSQATNHQLLQTTISRAMEAAIFGSMQDQ